MRHTPRPADTPFTQAETLSNPGQDTQAVRKHINTKRKIPAHTRMSRQSNTHTNSSTDTERQEGQIRTLVPVDRQIDLTQLGMNRDPQALTLRHTH